MGGSRWGLWPQGVVEGVEVGVEGGVEEGVAGGELGTVDGEGGEVGPGVAEGVVELEPARNNQSSETVNTAICNHLQLITQWSYCLS